MKIVKATVVLSEGADLVMLHTDLPSTMPKVTSQNLILNFHVAIDHGNQYLAEHFPSVPVEVIGRVAPYRK